MEKYTLTIDDLTKKLKRATFVRFEGCATPDRTKTRKGIYLSTQTGLTPASYFIGTDELGNFLVERVG